MFYIYILSTQFVLNGPIYTYTWILDHPHFHVLNMIIRFDFDDRNINESVNKFTFFFDKDLLREHSFPLKIDSRRKKKYFNFVVFIVNINKMFVISNGTVHPSHDTNIIGRIILVHNTIR